MGLTTELSSQELVHITSHLWLQGSTSSDTILRSIAIEAKGSILCSASCQKGSRFQEGPMEVHGLKKLFTRSM